MSPDARGITPNEYRIATLSDADNIALLHTSSWQNSYRGLFSDDFLANDALGDRKAIWNKRLAAPVPGQFVMVAEESSELLGFVCLFAGYDDHYGCLLDNLHVAPGHQRRGIGKQLTLNAMAWLQKTDPNCKMYLWVFTDNVDAISFYKTLGGVSADTMLYTGIGDRPVPAVRMIWGTNQKD